MIYAVVMLTLTVSNCDTGITLFEHTRRVAEFSVSGDRIEDCRKMGVEWAHILTEQYTRADRQNVSTNVKCWWKRVPGEPA